MLLHWPLIYLFIALIVWLLQIDSAPLLPFFSFVIVSFYFVFLDLNPLNLYCLFAIYFKFHRSHLLQLSIQQLQDLLFLFD